MTTSGSQKGLSPSQLIDARIEELGDWRGELLAARGLVKTADPEVVEEWKWRGVPVWSHAGMICTGETYKDIVKMTFAKGASLEDPTGLFNSSMGGNTRRAIDFHEDEDIDEEAVKALVGRRGPEHVQRPSADPRDGPVPSSLPRDASRWFALARGRPRYWCSKFGGNACTRPTSTPTAAEPRR